MWLGVRQVIARLAGAGASAYVALSACSGGYPLPPTACDEYCNGTLGYYCPDWYDPANCVADCEQNHYGAPECRPELDTLLTCHREHPEAIQARCSFDPNRVVPCVTEALELSVCANPSQYSGVPGYPSR